MTLSEIYLKNKKDFRIAAWILSIMITMTVTLSFGSVCYSDTAAADAAVNTTLGESLETYAGVFSTAVTASVNPTATLAALAVLGMVENASVYFPNAGWLVACGDFLSGVPLVRMVGDLPIANPVASVILVLVAIAMYVLHSTSVSKAVSKATVDNIEKWGGMVVTVGLALLPLATTQVAYAADVAANAAAGNDHVRYVTVGTYIVSLALSVISSIFNAVVYICIYGCIDSIEVIGAAVPIKGMNLLIEAAKAFLHFILIVLQLFSPILSVIASVVLMIMGLIFFRILAGLVTYYDYIYLKPVWKNLFHAGEMVPMVHIKFPNRGRKRYPNVRVAIPVFSMKRFGVFKKRALNWLIVQDDEPILVRLKFMKKVVEVPVRDMVPANRTLYLQKTFRFSRLVTEDRSVELILSNEYLNQWDELLAVLQVEDYQRLVEKKREEKRLANEAAMLRTKERFETIKTKAGGKIRSAVEWLKSEDELDVDFVPELEMKQE